MLNDDTIAKAKEVFDFLVARFDFSFAKSCNNRKDNLLFLMKDSSDAFIDFAKHSYSVLFEGLLSLYEDYKKRL